MFFRINVLVLTFLITSCSWWGGEDKTSNVAYVETNDLLKGKSVDCIMNTGTFFGDYFKGYSSSLEVNEMSSCVESTLDNMFEFAYKDDGIGFNRVRIQNILKSVSSKNNKLDNYEDVADLVFLLKRLLIGGEKNSFYKAEWDEFRKEMPEFKKALIEAHQSIQLIFYSQNQRGLAQREQDYAKIAKLFESLDSIKNKYNKSLELSEFKDLVRVLLRVSKLDHFTPLFEAASPIVLPNNEVFKKSQKNLFKITWKVFEMQSRYREMSFSEGFLAGESLADLLNATKLIVNSLSEWAENDEKNYQFEITDVKNTVKALSELGFLEDFISDYRSLNTTIENVFVSFFGHDVVDKEDLKALEAEVLKWTDAYGLILSKFSFPWVQPVLESIQPRGLHYSDSQVSEFENILKRFVKPQFTVSANKPIHIAYNQNAQLDQSQRFFDISFKHLFLSVSATMMKIYDKNISLDAKKNKNLAVDIEVLRKLFSDFRPIGLEMGFVNPYNCDSTDRIFIEANSLTFSGDANDTISIFEASEWLGTMVSVSSITDHVFTNAEAECSYSGTNLFGHKFNKRSCFRDSIFNKRSLFADFFPGFARHIDILSTAMVYDFSKKVNDWIDGKAKVLDYDNYKKIIVSSMNSCSYLGREDEFYNFPVSRGEFNSVTAAVLYVENIFQQFDTTGLTFGPPWNRVDPVGLDMILDGQEISKLLLKKATDEMEGLVVSYIKNNYPKVTYPVSENWIKNRLPNLPETLVKFDRSKIFELVHKFLSERVELNDLELQFCREVMESAKTGVIDYDTEAGLQCEPIR